MAKTKKTAEELIVEIQTACKKLGWCIAMDESSELVNGLILGQLPYIEKVLGQLDDIEKYSIYANPGDDPDLH